MLIVQLVHLDDLEVVVDADGVRQPLVDALVGRLGVNGRRPGPHGPEESPASDPGP
jgi:hypothetical protein